MLRTVKPKNARSKRAMEAREPKEVEDPRTAIFVRGSHPGEKVVNVMKDLMSLKRPNAISFSKKNDIRPFEDASSLEFWSQKNDASYYVVGHSNKKRPDGLVLVRMYDGRVLDMCELGVEDYVPISSFPGSKASPGHTPLMHFASELFDAHPRYIQLKSLLLDLFSAGEVSDGIYLKGIEHVISVTIAPTPSTSDTAAAAAVSGTGAEMTNNDNPATTTNNNSSSSTSSPNSLPKIHLRTYAISFQKSGQRTPYVALSPHGPSLDLVLRRNTDPDPTLLSLAMKKPKLKKKDIESGLGKRKRNKEVDDMGDLRGRIHVPKQDLSALDRSTKRIKALRKE